MNTERPALEVESLSFSYNSPVLRDISFVVPQGSFVSILGPNGTGKTTLFRCVTGLLKQDGGSIRLFGKEISAMSRKQIAATIGAVTQQHLFHFSESVLDVVLTGRTPHLSMFGVPGAADVASALDALEKVGIRHFSERHIEELSGGELQLVFLARALVTGARLLFLDEPAAHLDFNHQYSVYKTIHALCRTEGLTAILTVHDVNGALPFTDIALLMKNGSVLAFGPPEETITDKTMSALYDMAVLCRKEGERSFIFPFPDKEDRK